MQPAANEPTTLVIFGATGDLAERKLIPALWHLYQNGFLPPQFQVVGLARDRHSVEEFHEFAHNSIAAKYQHRTEDIDRFLQLLHYQEGLFEDAATYQELGATLSALDDGIFKRCSNKLFYLAVPPVAYENIFDHLAKSGLTIPCGGEDGWTRVLVEKPFGRDLATAQELDKKLGTLFQEEQIFRIDHYLAKETVQNIITFRFANALFEPVWNADNIDRVEITVSETIGVGERASFYEDNGALRDVGQNHMLQMLALIAMEDPKELAAEKIRPARAEILKHLVVPSPNKTIRGQYEGYRTETDVAEASETETYFKVVAELDLDRWRGVPFVLTSGKQLAEYKSEINIVFKEPVSCVCPAEDQHHQNVLTIRIQPDEAISLKFWAKKPGLTYDLEPKTLSFSYNDGDMELMLPDAYEKVLYDCIRGDQTLFASTEEVEAAWAFITPILEQWKQTPLLMYKPGSGGPEPRS